jgi:glycopeptide antibiotics resistance protein
MRLTNQKLVGFLTAVFLIYVFLLLGVVTLRFLDPNRVVEIRGSFEIATPNFEPLKTIKNQFALIGESWAQWNILANTVCFMPFGFLLPLITKHPRGVFFTAFAGCLFSACIETAQYVFNVGVFDVDDIILNTAGVILGYICARIIYAAAGKKTKKAPKRGRS